METLHFKRNSHPYLNYLLEWTYAPPQHLFKENLSPIRGICTAFYLRASLKILASKSIPIRRVKHTF